VKPFFQLLFAFLCSVAVARASTEVDSTSKAQRTSPHLMSTTRHVATRKAARGQASTKDSSSSKGAAPNKVLPPEQFFGQAALGYAAAKACPEICAKLFCYCGCDHTDEHSSLLDCFTCVHGVDCEICQEEAIDALRLKTEGKSLAEIQKYIDYQYAKQYLPDFNISPALRKYKASRLYKVEHDPLPQEQSKPANDPKKAISRKPGAKGCCPHKKSP
jgi:hypothetical protein